MFRELKNMQFCCWSVDFLLLGNTVIQHVSRIKEHAVLLLVCGLLAAWKHSYLACFENKEHAVLLLVCGLLAAWKHSYPACFEN